VLFVYPHSFPFASLSASSPRFPFLHRCPPFCAPPPVLLALVTPPLRAPYLACHMAFHSIPSSFCSLRRASADGVYSSETHGQMQNKLGEVQETAGKLMGSDNMQAKGNEKQVKGTTEEMAAKAGNVMEGAYNAVTGAAQNAAGALTGSNTDQASGTYFSLFAVLLRPLIIAAQAR
jgi:uncharacterized protein YjbJ (UPF0337 family)